MTPTMNQNRAKTAILLLFACLAAMVSLSAQQGIVIPDPVQQFFDSNGNPLASGKLCAYQAGSSTPLDTYTDSALTVPHSNPVIMNAAGRPQASGVVSPVYLQSRAYKFVLRTAGTDSTCSTGTVLWTADNIVGNLAPANVLAKTANYTVTVVDGKDVLILCNASGGSITVTTYTAVGNTGRTIRLMKTDSSANTCTLDGNGGEAINGQSTYVLPLQYDTVSVTSEGLNWVIGYGSVSRNEAGPCAGRLTGTSGTPVTTADLTAVTSIYWTPYKGNECWIYNGTAWQRLTFSEITISLSGNGVNPHDVFVYNNGGTLATEVLGWTNDTTRATALVLQNGIYVKSGQTSRRYVGTYRTTTTSQTEDSAAKRYIWNYYNRVPRVLRRVETTASWTYTTGTFRQTNASTANQVELVVGVAEVPMLLHHIAVFRNSSAGVVIAIGVGEDSTSTPLATCVGGNSASIGAGTVSQVAAACSLFPTVGRHFYAMLEFSDATGTTTWDSANNGSRNAQTGVVGWIEG
jgi:hypothetical protein